MSKDTEENWKVELSEKRAEVVRLRKRIEELEKEESHEITALKAELRASENFREEARKRCIRFEKIMFLMADRVEVFDEKLY